MIRVILAQWKIAPALAAGNTIVLKPSEMASVTCLEFGELCCRAGLPRGVLNVVTGTGQAAGAPLRYDFEALPSPNRLTTTRAFYHCRSINAEGVSFPIYDKREVGIEADSCTHCIAKSLRSLKEA